MPLIRWPSLLTEIHSLSLALLPWVQCPQSRPQPWPGPGTKRPLPNTMQTLPWPSNPKSLGTPIHSIICHLVFSQRRNYFQFLNICLMISKENIKRHMISAVLGGRALWMMFCHWEQGSMCSKVSVIPYVIHVLRTVVNKITVKVSLVKGNKRVSLFLQNLANICHWLFLILAVLTGWDEILKFF